jgi:hypothetical protein
MTTLSNFLTYFLHQNNPAAHSIPQNIQLVLHQHLFITPWNFPNTKHNVIHKLHAIVAGKISIENSDFKSLMKKISSEKYYRGFWFFLSERGENILRFFILILRGNFFGCCFIMQRRAFLGSKHLFFLQSRMSDMEEKAKRGKENL